MSDEDVQKDLAAESAGASGDVSAKPVAKRAIMSTPPSPGDGEMCQVSWERHPVVALPARELCQDLIGRNWLSENWNGSAPLGGPVVCESFSSSPPRMFGLSSLIVLWTYCWSWER